MYTARTGVDALQVLERQAGAVQLVLTDVVLPGIGGRELGARIADAYHLATLLGGGG